VIIQITLENNLCSSKYTNNRSKRKGTNWEAIISTDVFNKELSIIIHLKDSMRHLNVLEIFNNA
jgi:hypothetical protein